MPFRLQRRRTIPAAIVAVGDDLLRRAAAGLRTPSPTAAAIHRTRVALKRVRALLRLIVDPTDDAVPPLDHQLRDIGRSLAARREAGALCDCWEALAADAPSRAVTEFEKIGALLLPSLREPPKEEAAPMSELIQSLAEARRAWNQLSDDDDDGLIPQLTRSYRRSRKQFERLAAGSRAEAFHELRKRAKRLQYQIEFLMDMNPERWEKRHKRLQKLTDALGRHHDLEVLAHRIREDVSDTKARRGVLAVLRDRQSELAHRILERGRAVFNRKPRKFQKQWEQDLAEWQESRPAVATRRSS